MERGLGMNYKWKCQACKREFEQDVSLDNYDSFKASEHECPFCKKNAIFQRVFEPFSGSIQLSNEMYGIDGNGGWNA